MIIVILSFSDTRDDSSNSAIGNEIADLPVSEVEEGRQQQTLEEVSIATTSDIDKIHQSLSSEFLLIV
jgi:hypothetical protein